MTDPASQLSLLPDTPPRTSPRPRPSGMVPTGEQQEITDAVCDGVNVVAQARAGTGKTATLIHATRQLPRCKALYMAYNKAIALDARKRFPRNVDCRTLHSLAYAHTPYWVRDRLTLPRQNGRMVSQILGITQPLVIRKGTYEMPIDVRLSVHQLGRIAIETVRRFCYSADPEIGWQHVPRQQGFTDDAHEQMAHFLLPWTHRAWTDLRTPAGYLRFDHDFYLKIWAMGAPMLPYDLVLLDEAQDSNRLTSHLIRSQDNAQTVLVGDSDQQLYSWRGATDSMGEFPDHKTLYLTQSWRFGEEIAEMGNVFLRIRGADPLVRGNPALQSRIVQDMTTPDAILCRTNAGAMGEVIEQLAASRPVYLQGGGDAMKRLAEAAQELALGYGTNNPELCAFTTWSEVVDYAEQDPGGSDLRAFVRLVEEHGADAVIAACDKLVNAPTGFEDPKARTKPAPLPAGAVVVSTMHRSKGLEWDRVRIANDVAPPQVDPETWDIRIDPTEMMLNYVAATRAKVELDPGPLRRWAEAEMNCR